LDELPRIGSVCAGKSGTTRTQFLSATKRITSHEPLAALGREREREKQEKEVAIDKMKLEVGSSSDSH
jgi:hypothetical protein